MAYKSWATGDVLTSSDMNTYVRDQTITVCTSTTRPTGISDGKGIYETDTDRVYFYDATASAWVPIDPAQNSNQASYASTITGITNSTYATKTNGPAVGVTIGTSGRARISLKANLTNDTLNTQTWVSVAITGVSSVAATDTFAIVGRADTYGTAGASASAASACYSIAYLQTGLTKGLNTFTTQYRVSTGTASTGTAGFIVLLVEPIV